MSLPHPVHSSTHPVISEDVIVDLGSQYRYRHPAATMHHDSDGNLFILLSNCTTDYPGRSTSLAIMETVRYDYEDHTTIHLPPKSLPNAQLPFVSSITVNLEEFSSIYEDEEDRADRDFKRYYQRVEEHCYGCVGRDGHCREQNGQWLVPSPDPALTSTLVWPPTSDWSRYLRSESRSHLHHLNQDQLPVTAYFAGSQYLPPRSQSSTSRLDQKFHVHYHKPFTLHPYTTFVSSQWEGEATIHSAPRLFSNGTLEINASYWTMLGRRTLILQFFTNPASAPDHILPLFPDYPFPPLPAQMNPIVTESVLDFSPKNGTMILSEWVLPPMAFPFPDIQDQQKQRTSSIYYPDSPPSPYGLSGIQERFSHWVQKAWNLAFVRRKNGNQKDIEMSYQGRV